MLQITVTVETADAAAYGAGGLLRAERGPTWTEFTTVPLVAGQTVIRDNGGTDASTYRTRYSTASPTVAGDYSDYSAVEAAPSSHTSIAEVRALVRSRLSDGDLQDLIDREEAWLVGKIGALSGERTDTFRPGTTNTPLYLSRLTDSVSVTDNGAVVAAADLLFTPSTGCLRRVTGVYPWPYPAPETWFPSWQGAVAVTWTPTDGAAVTAAVIELVRGTVGETGMDSETIGDYSYTRGASAGRVSRLGLVRGLLLRRQAYSMSLRAVAEARP
jgi:hypothetical protein